MTEYCPRTEAARLADPAAYTARMKALRDQPAKVVTFPELRRAYDALPQSVKDADARLYAQPDYYPTEAAASAEARCRIGEQNWPQIITESNNGWSVRAARASEAMEIDGPMKTKPAGTLALVHNADADPFAPDSAPYRVQDAGEFATRPPLTWLIRGVLPQQSVAVIYGAWGTGKSFLAYDMAAAITRGLPDWFGHRVAKGNAVLICAEGQAGFVARQSAYRLHAQCEFAQLPGIIPASPNLLNGNAQGAVLKELKAYAARKGGLSLVIIDTKSAVTPGANENAHETASALVEFCKAVRDATGATVLLVDHTGAAATDRTRGHTSLTGAADAQIRVERAERGEGRTWIVQKLKDSADGERQSFRLAPVELPPDADGEPEGSCIVEQCEAPATAAHSLRPSGKYEPAVHAAIQELTADGKPADVDAVRALARSKFAQTTDAEKENVRKRVHDALNSLTAIKGLAYLIDGRVSHTRAVEGTREAWDMP